MYQSMVAGTSDSCGDVLQILVGSCNWWSIVVSSG